MKRRHVSFIETAIPPERGEARHYEHNDHTSYVQFNNDGKVTEIHTPQDALRRVHEVMHAKYSNPTDYQGARPQIKQIIEDCRLHLRHWPWRNEKTPDAIVNDANALFAAEDKTAKEAASDLSILGGADTLFNGFARKLRRNATYQGMRLSRKKLDHVHPLHRNLEEHIFQLIANGQAERASQLLERTFFGDEDPINKPEWEKPEGKPRPGKDDEEAETGDEEEEYEDGDEDMESYHVATMETIELPLVEPTDHHEKGIRLANSGSRIYRPALRRPMLPHRLFIKSAPVAPGGAILFDGSGSMDIETEVVLDCCRRAPSAAIATYRGDDSCEGWLYIFARDGMRAANLGSYDERPQGNSVDGPAMDWLMKQDGPRMFVTDREFCGSMDSFEQRIRLTNLELLGEIEVFTSYAAFQKRFPPIVGAA